MSDVWSELPLSRKRAADDESGVHNDWRLRTVDALRALASVIQELSPDQWDSPSLRRAGRRAAPLTVRQVVAVVPFELDRGALDRRLRRRTPIATDSTHSPVEAAANLRDRAEALSTESTRGALHPLTLVTQAAADITVPLGLIDPIAPLSSGAVALGLAAAAPTPLAAALRGRSLAPDDADWILARGPAIRGTSAELIAWLSGRDVIPRFDPAP